MHEAYRPPRSKCSLCCVLIGGGTPSSLGRGGTPSSLGWGVPHPMSGWGGYPIPCLDKGYPGYPRPVPGTGYPLSDGWGTPLSADGVPPAWTWDEVLSPSAGWDTPLLDLGWITPPLLPGPGMGYTPSAGWCTPSPSPPTWNWDRGTSPSPLAGWDTPMPKCEQIDTCENSTFPRTSYAGGKNPEEVWLIRVQRNQFYN